MRTPKWVKVPRPSFTFEKNYHAIFFKNKPLILFRPKIKYKILQPNIWFGHIEMDVFADVYDLLVLVIPDREHLWKVNHRTRGLQVVLLAWYEKQQLCLWARPKEQKGQTRRKSHLVSHLLVLVSLKGQAFFFSFFLIFLFLHTGVQYLDLLLSFPVWQSFSKVQTSRRPHMSASLQRASSVGGSLIARDTGPERTAKVWLMRYPLFLTLEIHALFVLDTRVVNCEDRSVATLIFCNSLPQSRFFGANIRYSQSGVSKLERAYHISLSRQVETFDTLEQVVTSLQLVAAILCRLLYYLTSSSNFKIP